MRHSPHRSGTRLPAILLVAGAGLLAAQALSKGMERRPLPGRPDSAPGRTSRRSYYGDYAVSGRTVTINRPRSELYDFWREFGNLAQVMENVASVKSDGDAALWVIRGPAGTEYRIRTRVVADRENEEIAWRSVEGSDIDTEGKIMFRDAPGGRGTEVEAIVAYVPPAGAAGQAIAKLFQREPRIQGRREMKRFKMLMETGEVATARNRKSD
ncbi:SRPBCC family protein [Pseudooceanicola sp.]|uniref:SRPBCC family protein n=1 Tax=Pseudooceanicola sp. TaxID=1914328 RepID=UPI0040589336